MSISLRVPSVNIIGTKITVPMKIVASEVTFSVSIIGSVTLNVAAAAGYFYIRTETAQVLRIDIAAQTAEAITFNVGAASARLSFNFVGQTEAIMLTGDWATKEAQDFHLQAKYTNLGAGNEATLITITLATNIEHWLYIVHISGTQNGEGYTRANKTGGYDWLSHGFFPANSGYIKSWEVPVKRRKDVAEGITEITVTVKNLGSSAGDFIATLDGLKITDVSIGEKFYTTQAEWEACTTKIDISTTASPGNVVLAYQT